MTTGKKKNWCSIEIMDALRFQKETKSKKEHRCDFCADKIHEGGKTHKHCAEIADRLKMYDDCEEGITQDDFIENINCEYDRLMIELIPPAKLQEHNEIMRQLRKVDFSDKLWYVIRHYKKIDKNASNCCNAEMRTMRYCSECGKWEGEA